MSSKKRVVKNDQWRYRLKELREAAGLNGTELAERAGITPQLLWMIENGKRNFTQKTLEEIFDALGASYMDIFKPDGIEVADKPNGLRAIPVISWIHAGAFAEPIDNWPPGVSGEGEPVLTDINCGQMAFALIVRGDSMEPMFLDGDRVVIDPDRQCLTGDFCVAALNGEVVLRKFYENEDEYRLIPLNDRYATTLIKKGANAYFKLIGRVVDLKRIF